MLSGDELVSRREVIEASPDLTALVATLARRNRRVVAETPALPEAKALLSVDGGRCADCGGALVFDPWSPRVHRCAGCGREHGGIRHDRAWARWQHLWLAGRAAETAALAVFGGDDAAAARARGILGAYAEHYLDFPNQDNVLGPARLFFSTYLESVWLTDYLAAAHLLREGGLLDDDTVDGVSRVADEAANLIGEFDEGFSNRQTWHNAALAAAAAWFEDEDLAARAIQGETGLLAHLLHGFGSDGLWYEGENYHLFALRGLLTGLGWSRLAGVAAFAEPALHARLVAALRAPALTALPDLTFPARRDARYGVSLAQPMYLEIWEVGLGRIRAAAAESGDRADEGGVADWLAALYESPSPAAAVFDSYLHEAGELAPGSRGRGGLSWWSLLDMSPSLGGDASAWRPEGALFAAQGLAVMRRGDRYASLECGTTGGGHGHPDRLQLTLHAGGVHWLADPGTGSYVSRDLFWYRSTLAHNAPRIDGRSQAPSDAACEAFDDQGDWAWARGRWSRVVRTLVTGPDYLLDLLETDDQHEHLVELPWHLAGDLSVRTPGRWEPADDDPLARDEFVSQVERFRPDGEPQVLRLDAAHPDGTTLTLHLGGAVQLVRGIGPGLPDRGTAAFVVARAAGSYTRLTTLITSDPAVALGTTQGDLIEVRRGGETDRHRRTAEGWDIERGGGTTRLAGRIAAARAPEPLFDRNRDLGVQGTAPWVEDAPALDGSLDGFVLSAPIRLDHEDQYRRSEEPYAGPDAFAAEAWINWNDGGLYVAVEVTTEDVVLRPAGAPPLLLDNERDEIHSAGIQVYLGSAEHGNRLGLLVVPEPGSNGVRILPVGDTDAAPEIARGAWERTPAGYRVTLAIEPPEWSLWYAGSAVAFDLLVNEMRPGRERRSGQLVWSGGGGWVWLRGDRQDARRFGTLTLT
jgi:hypothetical protein